MIKKETLYLDTSVVSAYSDTREPEKMEQTREFLERAEDNEVFISALVLEELRGIKDNKRIELTENLIKGFTLLEYSEGVAELAELYVKQGIIPPSHGEDALHIAYAVVNGLDIIVSWNFTHIVKRTTRHKINAINELTDYPGIEIIAPMEY